MAKGAVCSGSAGGTRHNGLEQAGRRNERDVLPPSTASTAGINQGGPAGSHPRRAAGTLHVSSVSTRLTAWQYNLASERPLRPGSRLALVAGSLAIALLAHLVLGGQWGVTLGVAGETSPGICRRLAAVQSRARQGGQPVARS